LKRGKEKREGGQGERKKEEREEVEQEKGPWLSNFG